MESDVGTLLFVTSLLGAGGLGLFYYGSEANSDNNDSETNEDKNGGNSNIKDTKNDELEELDDSFFGSLAGSNTSLRSKKSNTNSHGTNKSKRNGRKVRFNTKRRY